MNPARYYNILSAIALSIAAIFAFVCMQSTGWVKSKRPMVPLVYSCTTNYLNYHRFTEYMIDGSIDGSNNYVTGMMMVQTNFPASIVHRVVWGRKGKPIFVMNTQEVLKSPDGWMNTELIEYYPGTWIESVK